MDARPLLVFYDANCHLCQATRNALWNYDSLFEFVDILDPQIAQNFPQLRGRALGCQVHVIDENNVLSGGYDAVVEIASRVSSLKPFIPLLKWKPVHTLGWAAYRFVAKHRYVIFGRDGDQEVCTIAM